MRDTDGREHRTRTAATAFAYFAVLFWAWMLLAPIAPMIGRDLGLGPGRIAVLLATGPLVGALTRIPIGHLCDRHGERRAALVTIAVTAAGAAWGWLGPDGYLSLLVTACALGVAGASFAVAMPMAGRWYEDGRRGLVLGVIALGNVGAVLSGLTAPWIAEQVGWRGTFAAMLVPLAAVALVVLLAARDAPRRARSEAITTATWALLAHADTRLLCAAYAVTFGGFVGVTVSLPTLLTGSFDVAPGAAGAWASICAVGGTVARPLGGLLADRRGGGTVLAPALATVAAALTLLVAADTSQTTIGASMAAVTVMGLGSGVVFQLVPQRCGTDLGAATGLVGAAGGLGGFALPLLFGLVGTLGAPPAVAWLVAAAATVAVAGRARRLTTAPAEAGLAGAQP